MSNAASTGSEWDLALEFTPYYYHCGHRGASRAEPGVTLGLVVDEERFEIETKVGKNTALIAAFEAAFGVAPTNSSCVVAAGGFEFVGIGLSRWHAIFRGRDRSARRAVLRDTVRDLATLVDVSDAFTVFLLAGPMAEDVLARRVRIDLAAFPPGACATTDLHGMSVQLRRRWEGDCYECAIARSYGGSLFHALVRTADRFGLFVERPQRSRGYR